MADYELELVLSISDRDLSPDELTERIGLSPDKVSWKGARIEDPPIPKFNVWQISSPAAADDSSVQHKWEAFRERILPAKDRIHNLPKSVRKRMVLIIYANKYMPGLEFPVKTMKQIADFGVPLEVSTYGVVVEDDEKR